MASPSRIPPPRRSMGGPLHMLFALPNTPEKENRTAQESPAPETTRGVDDGPGSPAKSSNSDTGAAARGSPEPVSPFKPQQTQHRAHFLTHTRHTSIPKSPRKVFHSLLPRHHQDAPFSPSQPPPPPSPRAPSFALNSVPLAAHGVPNSASVCIPAQLQTGACLLSPTPSFLVAAHTTTPESPKTMGSPGGDGEAARSVKKGRRQGMRWLRPGAHAHAPPAPARESLMLATPSFVALGTANSTASFSSKYSLWSARRGANAASRKAASGVATEGLLGSEGSIALGSMAPPQDPAPAYGGIPDVPVADFFAPALQSLTQSQERVQEERVAGLPEDMLDVLGELEAVAAQVKALPIPDPPRHSLRDVSVSVEPVRIGSEMRGDADDSGSPDVATREDSTPEQPADEAQGRAPETIEPTCPKTPAVPSSLPRVGRMTLGRAVSTPSGPARTPAKPGIPTMPRRAFSEQAQSRKPAQPAKRPSLYATPLKPVVRTPTALARTPSISGAKTAGGANPRAPGAAALSRTPSVSRAGAISAVSAPGNVGMRVVSTPARMRGPNPGAGLGPPKLKSALKPRLSEPVASTASVLRKVSPGIPTSRIARRPRYSGVPRVG